MSRKTSAAKTVCNHFTEFEHGLPIAGIPAALPCPFCGDDSAVVTINSTEQGPTAVVICECCGAAGPKASVDVGRDITMTFDVVKEAARFWNERGGAPAN